MIGGGSHYPARIGNNSFRGRVNDSSVSVSWMATVARETNRTLLLYLYQTIYKGGTAAIVDSLVVSFLLHVLSGRAPIMGVEGIRQPGAQ